MVLKKSLNPYHRNYSIREHINTPITQQPQKSVNPTLCLVLCIHHIKLSRLDNTHITRRTHAKINPFCQPFLCFNFFLFTPLSFQFKARSLPCCLKHNIHHSVTKKKMNKKLCIDKKVTVPL